MFLLRKKFNNKYLASIEVFAIFGISIAHVIFGFLINLNYFNASDLINSSHLFNFSISENWQDKSKVAFHRYRGRKKYEKTIDYESYREELVIVDQTDINKINGKYFLL